ncbi:UNVERIFIED_ORG: hypothetical protein QIH99_gp06 [Proteus phage VB_PmiS-Isfahan]|uniref:Uncharacterized protein n=1 Tax=Proteus phage VB_PmiS-Isfahan TaxID=1969841 RepID=A0A1U9ZAB3_9CAUD
MDKSREQFEKWSEGKDLYNLSPFDIWQASRESLEVELPDLGDVMLDDYFVDGYNDALEDMKGVLSDNGVKIKNGTL